MLSRTRILVALLGAGLLAACSGVNREGPVGSNLLPSALFANVAGEQQAAFSAEDTLPLPSVEVPPEVQTNVQPEAGSAFENPGFETGKLKPWFACSGAKGIPGGKISTVHPYAGKYDAFSGNANTKTKEVNGFSGVCQIVTLPKKPYLSLAMYPVSNDASKSVGQVIGIFTTTGKLIAQIYGSDTTSKKWVSLKGPIPTTKLKAYLGKKVLFGFGVVGAAHAKKYIGQYIDNVVLIDK